MNNESIHGIGEHWTGLQWKLRRDHVWTFILNMHGMFCFCQPSSELSLAHEHETKVEEEERHRDGDFFSDTRPTHKRLYIS
jgi:hypothetical protein